MGHEERFARPRVRPRAHVSGRNRPRSCWRRTAALRHARLSPERAVCPRDPRAPVQIASLGATGLFGHAEVWRSSSFANFFSRGFRSAARPTSVIAATASSDRLRTAAPMANRTPRRVTFRAVPVRQISSYSSRNASTRSGSSVRFRRRNASRAAGGSLRSFGIPVVQHLPGVGQNFQDHVGIGCLWEHPELPPPRNNAAEVTYFWKSDSSLETPDLQTCQGEAEARCICQDRIPMTRCGSRPSKPEQGARASWFATDATRHVVEIVGCRQPLQANSDLSRRDPG
jgi:hypothetical protein